MPGTGGYTRKRASGTMYRHQHKLSPNQQTLVLSKIGLGNRTFHFIQHNRLTINHHSRGSLIPKRQISRLVRPDQSTQRVVIHRHQLIKKRLIRYHPISRISHKRDIRKVSRKRNLGCFRVNDKVDLSPTRSMSVSSLSLHVSALNSHPRPNPPSTHPL